MCAFHGKVIILVSREFRQRTILSILLTLLPLLRVGLRVCLERREVDVGNGVENTVDSGLSHPLLVPVM